MRVGLLLRTGQTFRDTAVGVVHCGRLANRTNRHSVYVGTSSLFFAICPGGAHGIVCPDRTWRCSRLSGHCRAESTILSPPPFPGVRLQQYPRPSLPPPSRQLSRHSLLSRQHKQTAKQAAGQQTLNNKQTHDTFSTKTQKKLLLVVCTN